MAVISFDQLLRSPVITRAISRIKTPQMRLQQFFGMEMGGSNIQQIPGDIYGWDIFDKTRDIATVRGKATGPATVSPQVIGNVLAQIPRTHEKIPMLEDRIFRTRELGKGWGQADIDVRGQQYVTRQEDYLAQRAKNLREFMVSRMLRGTWQFLLSGDDWIPVDSGGTVTVDYQVPSTNKTQLDMGTGSNIIGTTWLNTAAPIHKNLLGINAAMEQLHGRPLRHIWLNSQVMYYVFKNTEVINLGGTANTTFAEYKYSGNTNPEGIQNVEYDVVLRGIPWVRWHVYDGGNTVNGTYTKFLADNHAYFLPDPDPSWVEGVEGSEIVAENYIDQGTERYGLHAWVERKTQPASFELILKDQFLPTPYVPACIADGTVIF